MITTQDQAVAALYQLLAAAEAFKRAEPALLDSVMLSTPETGPRLAAELIEAAVFDLRVATARLANLRAARSAAGAA